MEVQRRKRAVLSIHYVILTTSHMYEYIDKCGRGSLLHVAIQNDVDRRANRECVVAHLVQATWVHYYNSYGGKYFAINYSLHAINAIPYCRCTSPKGKCSKCRMVLIGSYMYSNNTSYIFISDAIKDDCTLDHALCADRSHQCTVLGALHQTRLLR